MKKISSLSLFNTPVTGSDVEIDFEDNKSVLMLTGYNGSGKSRTIGVCLEALSLLRDVDNNVTSYDWIAELRFGSDVNLRALKIDAKSVSIGDIKELVQEEFIKPQSIRDVFVNVGKVVESHKPNGKFKSHDGADDRSFGCVAFAVKDTENADEVAEDLNVVAYIDSIIYFNSKRDVPDAVMKGQKGIEQTLYTLFYELAVKQAESNDVFEQVYALVKEYEEQTGESDKDSVRQYVMSRVNADQLLANARAFEDTEVFKELNKFFALTHRRLRWGNKHAFMELHTGEEVSWVDFSKGEKTLLALMLAVYLYGDNSLFILDEPDLSLHMEWQRMLVPAMVKLAPDAQFIISTHSPFMIMNTHCEQVVNMANFYRFES